MNICLFASGNGSNAEAILQSIDNGSIRARVCLIISDQKDAYVLNRAKRHGIPAHVVSPSLFASESSYIQELRDVLASHSVNFIALAGYLKKIPHELVDDFYGRMINIHPALLPAFGGPGMYGIRVHEAVLDKGVRWTGVTVHFVDHEFDSGPIILQKPVPVYQDDTPEKLAERVLQTEHQIYPEALRLFADGRVQLEDRRVTIDPMIPNNS